ncbi:Clp protease N-terminal domain-containing protein [Umezawaea endophytica]|uniref:ATP-dependent Clp protease ATP-binding subunit n=1 Tax=Umezawaea endophytica TaxID=1654476 RepID=A0A9X3A3A6_9PSEU|nr:Clp protease N-terminal domain-containing protein [Umezawaea endophytica]MCS7481529.1 ATP-dependent Clp protease ATP-binding subunit [Umezawaea endophytica]
MPKINVYLPDELAEAVKESGVPVSAVCQRALEESVKRVTAIRAVVLDDLASDAASLQLSRFTQRTRDVIALAVARARAQGAVHVGTEHLLHGMLAEGANLALHVLRAIEVDPDRVARELARREPTDGGNTPERFGGDAANALVLTVTEALTLGHNYVGCEHLLLGLVAEPDGVGGQALRAAGVDLRGARAAVVAALAGYVHLRAQPTGAEDVASALRRELAPLIDRLDRVERHVGLVAED